MLMLLNIYDSYRGGYMAKSTIFAPLLFSQFLATSILSTSKENIFHTKLGFMKNIHRLDMKKLKKLNFLDSTNSHRCVMY